jgi:hypothetical protein
MPSDCRNPEISIPEQLSHPHPMALRTETLLESSNEDRTNRAAPKRGVSFHIYVSRAQLSRALRIWNALLRALEECGGTFSWPEEGDSSLSLIIEGETLKFGICEIFNAKRHVLTRAEEKNPCLAPQWDYHLTGRLRLFIGKMPYASEGRKSWSDARHKRLENCLESFVLGLKVAAAATKKKRLENEERERLWELERKQEEERKEIAREDDRGAGFVTQMMRDWNESRCLRAFAKAVADAAQRLELSDQEKADIQQVVDWTYKYAKITDSTSNLPKSAEEFVNPESAYDCLDEEE